MNRQTPGQPGLSPRHAALSVARRLDAAGHVALFAGGCVRDMLMKRRPKDYDVATSAQPNDVIALFRRSRKVGAKFGVVLVGVGRYWIEVATFRRDLEYTDGRRPDGVEFTNAEEDAARRDFTINGLFFDPIRREFVDYVGGRKDIQAGIIRAIGDPRQRFAEDHLRLLRAVRFSARCGFKIHTKTGEAMREHAPHLARISPERIREELEMILTDPSRARGLCQLAGYGILGHLWPGSDELLPHAKSIRSLLGELPKHTSFALALAALLHPVNVQSIGNICEALRCSNETRRSVSWILSNLPKLRDVHHLALADLKMLMARVEFSDLLTLYGAEVRADRRSIKPYHALLARSRRISPDQIAPRPLLTGLDLEKLGVPRGPIYKKVLDRAYYAQLNEEIHTAAEARNFAEAVIRSRGS